MQAYFARNHYVPVGSIYAEALFTHCLKTFTMQR
jgi:hypothetical protein